MAALARASRRPYGNAALLAAFFRCIYCRTLGYMSVRKSVPMGPEDVTTPERMHAPVSPGAPGPGAAHRSGAGRWRFRRRNPRRVGPSRTDAVTQQVATTGYAAWAAEMDDEDRDYRTARRGWDRGNVMDGGKQA